VTDLRLAPLRLLWVTLPFTLGPLLAEALDTRDDGFRSTVSVGCWVVWAAVVVAALIPRALSLTVVRVVVPATVPAALWAGAAADDASTAATVSGLAAAGLVAAAVFFAPVGEAFVDGSSYGDERRMPLRPPGVLLLGPIEIAWVLAVIGATAGPLLLADRRWIAGGAATAVGLPVALLAGRALHRMARRWLVFVPAGFVVHDHLVLAEPMLFPRSLVTAIGIAAKDTHATDLTAGALGVALEARLAEATSIAPARRDRAVDTVEITTFLVSPSRPGAALLEARRRRITVEA
jgi:hypothetical protein